MPRIVNSVTIDAPIEDVFDFVTDPRNNPRWQAGVESVSLTPDGPPREGTRVVETRVVGGRRVSVPFTIDRVRRPSLREFTITGGPLRASGRMQFERLADARTHVTVAVDIAARRPARWLMPLVSRVAQRRNQRDFATVRSLLEGERRP